MSENTPADGEKDGSFVAISLMVGLILLIILALPLLIAMPIYFILKNRLKFVEYLSGLAFSLVLFLTTSIFYTKDYVKWVVNFFYDQNVKKSDIPFLYLLSSALMLALAVLVFRSTRFSSKIPSLSGYFKKEVISSTGLMPNYEEKELAKKIATVPDSAMTISKEDHSVSSELSFPQRRFPLGIDKSRQTVYIHESELRYHGIIFGSTGSGKTELIKSIAGGLLDLGWYGMILDLKEDTAPGGLKDWCEEYSIHHALPFQEFALSNPEPKYWFSPLHGIGPDEALSTILASQKFEDAFYRALNEKQLGQLITLMHLSHKIDPARYPELTVYDIGNILSSQDLREACKEMVALVTTNLPDYDKKDFDSLMYADKQLKDTAIGLGARLTGLFQTQVGRVALRPGEGREEIDVTIAGLTYVGLDSMGKGEITRLISASVLRRMSVYAADRISGKEKGGSGKIQPRFLIIDEANFVDKKILLELLSRARSAYITCIVCTQGPSDWLAKAKDEPDLTSLLNNCNVSFIMSQGEQSNAEVCASIIGMENKQDITQRIDALGEVMESGTMRNVVDYVVSADEIRSLSTGEVIIRISRPSVRRLWAQTAMRDPARKIR